MPFILLALVIIGLIVGPGLWVKRVLASNSRTRADLPGTGGELAAHLMEKFELQGVTLERTELGDHYDTQDKAIRLTANVMDGKSLTAVATAAHEFGHALQDSKNYAALTTRTLVAKNAGNGQRIAHPVDAIRRVSNDLERNPVTQALLGRAQVVHRVSPAEPGMAHLMNGFVADPEIPKTVEIGVSGPDGELDEQSCVLAVSFGEAERTEVAGIAI